MEQKDIKESVTPTERLKLLSVTNPIAITDERLKKKFALKVKYEDTNGKMHNKTIRFGHKGVQDFVEHKDEKRLTNLKKRMRNNHHFLQPNFWRDKLLNQKSTLEEAFSAAIKELNLL